MMQNKLPQHIKRFVYAGKGLRLIAKDRSARLHFLLAGMAAASGIALRLPAAEWLWIVSAVFAVIVTEALNSAIEKTVDLVTLEQHPLAGQAKDIAAAAVLLSSVYALLVAALVMGPRAWAVL